MTRAEVLQQLVKVTKELNRCLLMADDKKMVVSVQLDKNVYEQDGKIHSFPKVLVFVEPSWIARQLARDAAGGG